MTEDPPTVIPPGDPLAHRANATPDRTAVVDLATDDALTYRELDAAVDAAVELLEGEVSGQDDAVVTLLGTRREVAVVLFATMRLGARFVPLDPRQDAETLSDQLDRVGPSVVCCESDTLGRVSGITDANPIDVDETTLVDQPAGSVAATDPRTGPAAGRDTPSADADAASWELVLFTSGTTGRRKGVRLTAGNLLASATASAFRLGLDPDDRWLVPLPTCHAGGLAPIVRSTLYGTTVVLQPGFDPSRTAAATNDRGVTCVSLVPTMLTRMLDDGWRPPDDLRFVLLGGAPASEDLLERCDRHDVPVCPTYGTTETASQIATAGTETALAHPGTVGQPLAFTDVTVVDDEGDPVPAGEVGEIVVSGPTVSPGYLDGDRTAAAFGDDGFHTGDLGHRDEDGRLWVVGRVDDRIVTGGENVAPGAVADVLRGVDGVAEAFVTGLPDEKWGQRVAALVVPADGSATPEAIREACRGDLADYEVPKTVRLVDELPRTDSGTVDRERARALLAE